MTKTIEYVGLMNEADKLVWASECNSQIEGSEFDGPVLWTDLESATEVLDDNGGIPDGQRLVKVTVTIDEFPN